MNRRTDAEKSSLTAIKGSTSLQGIKNIFLKNAYLKGIVGAGNKEKKEGSAICWLTLKMAGTARVWPGWSKKPGASSSSLTWVAGAQARGSSVAAFPHALAGC